VTEHCWQWDEILSGKQQVGVTEPGRPDVDEHFASDRRRDIDLFNIKPDA